MKALLRSSLTTSRSAINPSSNSRGRSSTTRVCMLLHTEYSCCMARGGGGHLGDTFRTLIPHDMAGSQKNPLPVIQYMCTGYVCINVFHLTLKIVCDEVFISNNSEIQPTFHHKQAQKQNYTPNKENRTRKQCFTVLNVVLQRSSGSFNGVWLQTHTHTHTCSSSISSCWLCPGVSSFSISDITLRFPFTSANSLRNFCSWTHRRGHTHENNDRSFMKCTGLLDCAFDMKLANEADGKHVKQEVKL